MSDSGNWTLLTIARYDPAGSNQNRVISGAACGHSQQHQRGRDGGGRREAHASLHFD